MSDQQSKPSVIRTDGLTKRFRSITAVDGVSLDVREGDVYGFLGANGSGKTTTVRMLLGLVLATSGTAEVLGQAMPAAAGRVLPHVGAMIEGPAAYPHLSGRRNLTLLDAMGRGSSRLGRSTRVGEALEQVGLAAVDDRPAKAYSLGMRQRLGLAGALLQRPRLLILDEPTNGLDPQGIRDIRALLVHLSQQGTTVFLSSHLLAEIDLMCTRVGVLDQGHLVLQDHLENLRGPTGRVVVRTPDASRVREALADGRHGHVHEVNEDRVLVADATATDLNSYLVGAGVRISELTLERRTLEEVVLEASTTSADVHQQPREVAHDQG